ncbi:MAG: (2Fe-2S)-binding protein [Planctomycetes bacterium]|nr:(2Fe-2S)-binding protein [Planctomycetota bacterium]
MGTEETRPQPSAPAAPPGEGHDAASLSRRRFLQALGLGATVVGIPEEGVLGHALPPEPVQEAGAPGELGPGPVPVTLKVNGQPLKLLVEPRVTLLDALRNHLRADSGEPVDLTGAKRVCDRASCGACTVILDGRTAYACTVLAVDAQDREIRTVDGLEAEGKLHPVQEAFVHEDGLQCGFCTPGFVMSAVALLEANPHPTREEILRGLDGNICRCGTQCGVVKAVEAAAAKMGTKDGGR